MRGAHQFPQDIERIRKQYFSSDDQLLTLALAATAGFGNMDVAAREWKAARDVGARITVHASGKDQLVKLSKAIKLDSDIDLCPLQRLWHLTTGS